MTDDLPAGRSNCILLGLPDDPRTHFAFAHAGHRCHALRRPEPVDEAFQETFCLAARHAECPRYRVWAAQRGEPSMPAAPVMVGAAAAASGAGAGEEAAAPEATAPSDEPTPELEPATREPAAPDVTPPDVVPPAAESAAAPLAWSADALAGREVSEGPPQEPGSALKPVPAAAPSLSRGSGAAAPGPARRSGRGWLARLVRGALILVLLVAAAGAAGYGLAFVMTRMSDGAGGQAVDSPAATLLSPSAVAASGTPRTASAAPLKTKAPTALPKTPAPTKAPAYRIHVVKSGEYLSAIAAKYKTTVEAIVELNKLSNANVIYPGQKLLIPPP